MKLKKATLLAIIGSAVSVIVGIYYLLSSFEIIEYAEGISKSMNVLSSVGNICILVFFIVLYSNQKNN